MRVGTVAVVASAVVAVACASAPIRLPDGPTRPLAEPEASRAFQQATASCRSLRTFTAEVGLSGHFGAERLRGRVLAGFDRTSTSVRLEAPAPFGAPVFILVARDDHATLLLPRSDQVVADASLEDVIEALTGLRRNTRDLLALLAGCLVDDPRPDAARSKQFESGWLSVPMAAGGDAFLRSERQQWRLGFGRVPDAPGTSARSPWLVSYTDFVASFPATVRLSRPADSDRPGAPGSDVRFAISQVEANETIDASAFALKIPGNVKVISIDDLRQLGPLADRSAEARSR
jgi:hypothetical protein